MRQITYVVAAIAAITLTTSCLKETDSDAGIDRKVGVIAETPDFTGEYDRQFNDVAVSVSNAVRNHKDFRVLIADEAKIMFDGAYDVLFSAIMPQEISVSGADLQTRSGGSGISVKELLEFYSPSNETRTKAGNPSIIEELQAMYPDLQVSVPVHAETWDPETYIPTVVFMPEGFRDFVTKKVPGYNSDGDFVWVDAVNIPDMPVIVVGRCERLDSEGEVYPEYQSPGKAPGFDGIGGIDLGDTPLLESYQIDATLPLPVLISASTVASGGIKVNWSYLANGSKHTGFMIYRQGPNDTHPQRIKTIKATTTRSYIDYELYSPNVSYDYFVASYYDQSGAPFGVVGYRSELQNIPVEAISGPSPAMPSAFSVHLAGKDRAELRWNNDNDNYSNTVISRYISGTEDGAFEEILNSPNSTGTDYMFTPAPVSGKEIVYRARRTNNLGSSNYFYDFIIYPYRDPNTVSPVYVKHISHKWGIETWLGGPAEFMLKVLGHTSEGKTIEVQSEIWFEFKGSTLTGYSNKQSFNKKVLDLRCLFDNDLYKAYTFILRESDINSEVTLSASASINRKVDIASLFGSGNTVEFGVALNDRGYVGLKTESCTPAPVSFSNNGEECGQVVLNYFDNPEQTLEFPKWGVKMIISQEP